MADEEAKDDAYTIICKWGVVVLVVVCGNASQPFIG
jgi:hypothetical protein